MDILWGIFDSTWSFSLQMSIVNLLPEQHTNTPFDKSLPLQLTRPSVVCKRVQVFIYTMDESAILVIFRHQCPANTHDAITIAVAKLTIPTGKAGVIHHPCNEIYIRSNFI